MYLCNENGSLRKLKTIFFFSGTETNTESSALKEVSSGGPPAKKRKKCVTWAEDSKLESISYFQLDETERGML